MILVFGFVYGIKALHYAFAVDFLAVLLDFVADQVCFGDISSKWSIARINTEDVKHLVFYLRVKLDAIVT